LTTEPDLLGGPSDLGQSLAAAIEPVFRVESITTGPQGSRTIQFLGTLLTDSSVAHAQITSCFEPLGYMALLRKHDGRTAVIAVPLVVASKSRGDRGAWVLLALTVVSMLFTSAAAQAPDLAWILRHPLAGLPFTASLLAILGAHELGHYWMARRLGIDASPPYFIPMPFSIFGTMGAIMRTRSPLRNRRQVLALGVAGPLAGLVIAIPVLLVGLLRSTVQPISALPGAFIEGNSLLYLGLKYLVFRRILPGNGMDVFLDPVAFAAWAGLLLTSVNLIPAGQLDGGHIAYALLGRRTRWLSRLAIVVTGALGFVWSGWFIWSAVLFVFGQRNAEPLDDVTGLRSWEKALAVIMLVTFVLLFTPVPMSIL
jgi:hypothetical protein